MSSLHNDGRKKIVETWLIKVVHGLRSTVSRDWENIILQ